MIRPLPEALKGMTKDSLRIVEIGVYRGNHAKAILETGCVKKIYLVDPYKECYNFSTEKAPKIYRSALNNVKKWENKVCWLSKDSLDCTPKDFDDELVDIVYIDGLHTYKQVSQELVKYSLLLKGHGLLCGDDYHIEGVKKAVDEFVENVKRPMKIVGRDFFINFGGEIINGESTG